MVAATAEKSPNREIVSARAITDALFRQVRAEAYFDRPIPERHRIIFYIGHLEAFDWNLLGRTSLGMGPVSEEMDSLFAFGIDPPPGQLPQDKPGEWPSIPHTLEYVKRVREAVDARLDDAPLEAVEMALEHRLMHAETFSYILHNMPYSRRMVQPAAGVIGAESPEIRMVDVPGGVVTLGRHRNEEFGWDNEFCEHTYSVPDFAMSKHKITNGQYLDFVRAGGSVPHYWFERHGDWYYRGMSAEAAIPNDWPVYVSLSQAQAYAGWAGKALATEAQFHRAAFGAPEGIERKYPWGTNPPGARHGNFNLAQQDLVSVTATPDGDSAFGISQLVGNGWEWTSSVFAPFPGFESSPAYPGYSQNFFDGDHFVLKGGSCATDERLLRRSFRNWFRRDYPYAYSTFRLVEN